MEQADLIREWLISVLAGIVIHDDAILVSYVEDDMGILYSVKVHADDRGKVIGKEGEHAKALRKLLRCAGMRFDIRASLKVDVPEREFKLRDEDRA